MRKWSREEAILTITDVLIETTGEEQLSEAECRAIAEAIATKLEFPSTEDKSNA